MRPLRPLLLAAVVVLPSVGCRDRQQPPTYGSQQPPYGQAPYGQAPYGTQPPPQQPPPQQPPAQQAPPPAFPWPFPLPPGFQLPPPPAGWAFPGLPLPGVPQPPVGQPPPAGGLPLPDARGKELADRINAYRVSRGLPPVPLSRSLGIVAAAHVRDQESNHPDQGSCNQHSWSQTPPWTGCCYTPDHAQASCMWRKPSEITGWKATGYEISTKTTGTMTPADAVASWQSSPAHHAVMISEGTWSKKPWLALGAACGTTHAVAWFAEETDPAGAF